MCAVEAVLLAVRSRRWAMKLRRLLGRMHKWYSAMNCVFTSDQTVRFLFGPLAKHHRTLTSPARISPASTTEQKQHQDNNQYGYHVSPPL